jgi:hypothetical protein
MASMLAPLVLAVKREQEIASGLCGDLGISPYLTGEEIYRILTDFPSNLI